MLRLMLTLLALVALHSAAPVMAAREPTITIDPGGERHVVPAFSHEHLATALLEPLIFEAVTWLDVAAAPPASVAAAPRPSLRLLC